MTCGGKLMVGECHSRLSHQVGYHVTMLKLQVPASFIISGASGSGKTQWIYELFKKNQALRQNGGDGFFEKPFDREILSYKQYQPLYDKFVD